MGQVAEAEAPYSPNWWKTRSTEQLQQMVGAGFAADQGVGAMRELERRAQANAAAEERQAQRQVVKKEDRRLQILAIILIALIISVGVVLLIR